MREKMNITNKLLQQFVIDKFKKTDWSKGTDAPLVVELDTTEVCDMACPGCISEDLVANCNSFSNDRLMELGKEMYESGVKAVILIGGGEPLAHPKSGELIKYLAEHDISVGITTNGTFIGKYMDIIAKYASWTRVSVDVATEGMFNKLRPSKNGKSRFEEIIGNMKELAKIKKGKLGFSFLIRTEADGFGLSSNIHEIYDAAVLAKDIGCDYFEVKPSYNFAEGVAHSLVKHSKERMAEARKEIEKLSNLRTDKFRVIEAINLEESLNGVEKNQDKDYTTCPMTELRTLVCPSGVFVCPYWRGKERYRVGEVHSTQFKDMWSGNRRKEVMKNLNPKEQCTFHCLRHMSNIEAFELIKKLKSGEEIEIIDEYDRFI